MQGSSMEIGGDCTARSKSRLCDRAAYESIAGTTGQVGPSLQQMPYITPSFAATFLAKESPIRPRGGLNEPGDRTRVGFPVTWRSPRYQDPRMISLKASIIDTRRRAAVQAIICDARAAAIGAVTGRDGFKIPETLQSDGCVAVCTSAGRSARSGDPDAMHAVCAGILIPCRPCGCCTI